MRRRPLAIAVLVLGVVLVVVALGRGGGDHADESLTRPVDPSQQTLLAFGQRSHWLQPWRAYLDTPPAARMLDAVGMQLNVSPPVIAATARLLASAGVVRVRVEIGWDQMSFEHPGELRDPAGIEAGLHAIVAAGLRPLILLNANSGAPGPLERFPLRLVQSAPAGSRTVRLDRAAARQVVPGRTGIDADGRAAGVLLLAVGSDGEAQLSRPLPVALPAGEVPASTLRFGPFTRPRRPDGSANPAFEQTLGGWLDYAGAVTRAARAGVGSDAFDVEVWNELAFGSEFLDPRAYYDPVPTELRGRGDVTRAILTRTVAWLRDPAHGVGSIGIGDGFANQTPFPAGSTSPPGITALDKHPYRGLLSFPGAEQDQAVAQARPLDALGHADEKPFTPAYAAFFPEYYLTGIQTETLVRDLSPITTPIGSVAHGRATHPPGAAPPATWITETNLDPTGTPLDPRAGADPKTFQRFQAKVLLRLLSAYVNKGVSALYLYAASGDRYGFVSQAALDAAGQGGQPRLADAGLPLQALRRFLAPFRGGPAEPSPRRALELRDVEAPPDRIQFAGDGTPGHPALRDSDVTAFLPFQVGAHRWVAPAYVMTRDLTRSPAPEEIRLTVGGVDGQHLRARAIDPLDGSEVPVQVLDRQEDSVVLRVELTDSPRVLELED